MQYFFDAHQNLLPMSIRFGVIVFPGSNCDHDAYHVAKHVLGQDARFIWHKDTDLGDVDFVIVPGGFSYGDYLRSGAIARFSPIMKDVVRFANAGGPVMGICNGFQILCESGLLPGALMRNESLRFVCKNVQLKTENTDSVFTNQLAPGDVLAHIDEVLSHADLVKFADLKPILEQSRKMVVETRDAIEGTESVFRARDEQRRAAERARLEAQQYAPKDAFVEEEEH